MARKSVHFGLSVILNYLDMASPPLLQITGRTL